MKKVILCGLITLVSLVSHAQQTPHYTQYLYNLQMLNPAYIGNRADLSISLASRWQWAGVEGAPKTQTLSLNTRLNNGLGLGATVFNDEIGLSKNTNVNIDASYTLILSEYDRLSLGLKAGIGFFNNNLADGITPDNEVYTSTTGSYPNVGLGVYYYNPKFYAGLSLPYLLKTPQFRELNSENANSLSPNTAVFITSGVYFNITEDVIFKPSTLIKYRANLPLSVDFNANFLYKTILEAGVSYRYNDAMSAMFAIIISEKVRIGYAYDQTLTSLGSGLNSHEIILHLDLDLKRDKRWLYHQKCYF